MKFIGHEVIDSQVAAALTFLNAEWRPTSAESRGSFGQPQAMWSVYEGLAATIGLKDTTHIVQLLTDCGATRRTRADQAARPSCTWSEDYSQWLVDNQKADGSWGGDEGIVRSCCGRFLRQYTRWRPDPLACEHLARQPARFSQRDNSKGSKSERLAR